MLTKLAIAFSLMALCVTIHAMGIMTVFRSLQRCPARSSESFRASAWRLIRVASWTVFLHLTQILVWAAVYAVANAMPDFTTAAYFSAVTYTTTGYGDLVLPEEWRLVGGVEALTGILMCGLSTGMFFAVFAKIFDLKAEADAPS